MVVAFEFNDNPSTIYNARNRQNHLWHNIHDVISNKHFPLSKCLSNKESSKSIYHLSVKANKRKKNSENNSAVKPLGCASWFQFSFERCRRHFYDQKG